MRLTKDEYKLVDQFDSAYWSGLDLAVYANNIHVDEALQFNYQVVEQVRPYYGYASYVPDKIYHGTRIISGELTINFKRDGYLFSLLNLLTRQKSKDVWMPSKPISTDATTGERVRPPTPFVVNPWGPQQATKISTQTMSGDQAYQLVQAKLEAGSQRVLDRFQANIPQTKGIFETSNIAFDLNIIFGGNINSALSLKYIADSNEYYADGAVIDDNKSIYPATGLKIIGVEIMGLAKSIADDGRAILETYTFQAKDIGILSSEVVEGFSPSRSRAKAEILTNEGLPKMTDS
jgi:hypothetical protein